MIARRIITGFVIQNLDMNGKVISQEFVAGEVSYEDEFGDVVVDFEGEDFPLEMRQPE